MLVYKYRGNSKDYFERDLETLEKNSFWASTSENLNDPCETITSAEKFIKQTNFITKGFGIKSEADKKFLHESFENVLSFDKKMGIYSLSQSYLDELLWAHYASSHNGYCIEYDLDLLIDSYSLNNAYHFPINYSNKPPSIGVLDVALIKNNGMINKMGGFKSKRWEYEQEYRIITNNAGFHIYNFNALKSIYFGLRMTQNLKEEIMNRLKGRGIKYFQIEQIDKSYNFTKVPIEDINGEEITYLRQLKFSEEKDDFVQFEILKNKMNSIALIGEVEIEIERKIQKSELKLLAEYFITNLFHTAKKIYMFYYLKDKPNRDFAWATTNFDNDKIEITINDY
jgi:hypothetical protein